MKDYIDVNFLKSDLIPFAIIALITGIIGTGFTVYETLIFFSYNNFVFISSILLTISAIKLPLEQNILVATAGIFMYIYPVYFMSNIAVINAPNIIFVIIFYLIISIVPNLVIRHFSGIKDGLKEALDKNNRAVFGNRKKLTELEAFQKGLKLFDMKEKVFLRTTSLLILYVYSRELFKVKTPEEAVEVTFSMLSSDFGGKDVQLYFKDETGKLYIAKYTGWEEGTCFNPTSLKLTESSGMIGYAVKNRVSITENQMKMDTALQKSIKPIVENGETLKCIGVIPIFIQNNEIGGAFNISGYYRYSDKRKTFNDQDNLVFKSIGQIQNDFIQRIFIWEDIF